MTIAATEAPLPASPLAIPAYRRFLAARFMAAFAQTAMIVVIGWQTYDVARSLYGMAPAQAAFQLGILGLVQFIPLLLLTPVAGWAADRFDRRHVAALSFATDALVAGGLWLATATDALTLPLIFALAALHGTVRVFTGPATSAIAPNLVPPALLPRTIALSSLSWQIASVLGPAAGGLLYAALDFAPYAVAVALLATSVTLMASLPRMARPKMDHTIHPLRQMAEGLRYVRHDRFLLGCITLDLFAVLMGGATALLPVYARDILQVGPEGLGQMRAAPAIGAAITALLLAVRPLERNVGVKMLGAVALFGAATVGFGLSRWYPLSLAMLAVLGAADMVSVFVRNSLVQLKTPDGMRGRVGSVSGLAISASNELGELESGLLAAVAGPVGAVVLGGAGAIMVTGIWFFVFPELKRARTFTGADAKTSAGETA